HESRPNRPTDNHVTAKFHVYQLFCLGNTLAAVTHGRGMFYATPNGGPLRPVDLGVTASRISGGNGNGSVDPNECNPLNLVIQNFGETTARDVTGLLATDMPGVSIIQP